VFERLKTGTGATVVGALLLILGGVVTILEGGYAGTVIALVGCLMVVRERMRPRG